MINLSKLSKGNEVELIINTIGHIEKITDVQTAISGDKIFCVAGNWYFAKTGNALNRSLAFIRLSPADRAALQAKVDHA
jgi:hypothetical protein